MIEKPYTMTKDDERRFFMAVLNNTINKCTAYEKETEGEFIRFPKPSKTPTVEWIKIYLNDPFYKEIYEKAMALRASNHLQIEKALLELNLNTLGIYHMVYEYRPGYGNDGVIQYKVINIGVDTDSNETIYVIRRLSKNKKHQRRYDEYAERYGHKRLSQSTIGTGPIFNGINTYTYGFYTTYEEAHKQYILAKGD